ncbi:coiled-coil domain-containing protein [Helicobacter mustelae]|nr:hypothetical protein [Helicobacter mustelae]SQH71621.1 Uncharacterised protein [Helicobacter mustelae]
MSPAYQSTLEILRDFYLASHDLCDFNNNIANNLLRILNSQEIPINAETTRALSEFYSSKGLLASFEIQKDFLKISTKITNPSDNAYVFFLTKWIKAQFRNQRKFTQETLHDILVHAKQSLHLEDEFLFRDILRAALKKSLNLHVRDSLFFKNLDIRIKKFDHEFAKINQELRSLKKLDPSKLLTLSDKKNIMMLLKNAHTKTLLQKSAEEAASSFEAFPLQLKLDFYELFLHNTTQKFRLKIGKFLSNKTPSIYQTCYAREYVMENLWDSFYPLSKQMLEYVLVSERFFAFTKAQEDSPISKDPKQKEQILKDFFATQDAKNHAQDSFQNLQSQIKENSKTIFNLQQQSLKKDQEIQELRQRQKDQKTLKGPKEGEGLQWEKESQSNEKALFAEKERLKDGINKLKQDNEDLDQKLKIYENRIQDLDAEFFMRKEKFYLLCGDFAKYLVSHYQKQHPA